MTIREAINPRTGVTYWVVETTHGPYRYNIFHDLNDAAEYLLKEKNRNEKGN